MEKDGVIDRASGINISDDYRELVDKADKYDQDFFIDNSTIEHAKYLTYKLIDRAKKYIKIFTGDLSEIYYNNGVILNILEQKLNKNIKVDIVTINGIKSKEFIEFLKKYNKNLSLHILKDKTSTQNHFLLVDGTSFRVELPHSPFNVI